MSKRNIEVWKFGGTSVGDEERINNACERVLAEKSAMIVVVVSAMADVTKELKAAAQLAVVGEIVLACKKVDLLMAQHTSIMPGLKMYFDLLKGLLRAVNAFRELTPKMQDAIYAWGEFWSFNIFAKVLKKRGCAVQAVDAKDFMITDDNHGQAAPMLKEIKARLESRVLPHLSSGKVVVLPGYIGSTKSGSATTLGEGGSDYTAALVAEGLNARLIRIFTDVPGIMTANPRIVGESAKTIPELSFSTGEELAAYGAKLHPATLDPAKRLNIPVWVGSSFDSALPGTKIWDGAVPNLNPVVGIASMRHGVAGVTVESSVMENRPGYLSALYEVLRRYRVSADVVATSQVSVSTTIPNGMWSEPLEADLRALGKVSQHTNWVAVSVVMNPAFDVTDTEARVFACLRGLPRQMISRPATRTTLSLVFDASVANDAIVRLHQEFFPKEE